MTWAPKSRIATTTGEEGAKMDGMEGAKRDWGFWDFEKMVFAGVFGGVAGWGGDGG